MEEKKGIEIEVVVNVPVRIRYGVLNVTTEKEAYDKIDKIHKGDTKHLWDVLTFPSRHGLLDIRWDKMKWESLESSRKITFTEGLGMKYEEPNTSISKG